jgi:hypothetical protein
VLHSQNVVRSNEQKEEQVQRKHEAVILMAEPQIFPYSSVRDDNGQILELFHGTTADFDKFDSKMTVDGGFHFGSRDQAVMRSSGNRDKYLIKVALNIKKPRESKDSGSGWKSKIQSAKKAGFDGIVYLNRFEGIGVDSLAKALELGVDLDRLSDSDFKKLIPEATYSWIVFDPHQIKVLDKTTVSARKVVDEPRPEACFVKRSKP